MKDLANLDSGEVKVKRRHSISKCETVKVSQTGSEVRVGGSLGRGTSYSSTIATPTLNLSLCEVGHIRSVLVRAEIEVSRLIIISYDPMGESDIDKNQTDHLLHFETG